MFYLKSFSMIFNCYNILSKGGGFKYLYTNPIQARYRLPDSFKSKQRGYLSLTGEAH